MCNLCCEQWLSFDICCRLQHLRHPTRLLYSHLLWQHVPRPYTSIDYTIVNRPPSAVRVAYLHVVLAVTYLLAKDTYMYNDSNSRIHCHLSYSLRFIVSLCPTVCQSCDNYTVPHFNVQLSCYRSTGVLSYFRLFSVQQTRPIIFIVNCTACILLLFLVQQVGPRAF